MRGLSSFLLELAVVLRLGAACPEDYVECASEGGTCAFDGQRSVAYGEQGTYVYQTADGSIGCDNGVFGDPLGGVRKKCCYADPNEDDWLAALIVSPSGKSFDGGQVIDIGADAFNTAFQNSAYHLLRLELDCDSCVSYKQTTYYRRFTDTATFEPYEYMADWTSDDNQINVDFALYSTLSDALNDTNRWQYCNYDDPSVGAFRDCGPTGWSGNWGMTGTNSNAQPGRISIYVATPDTTSTASPATDCEAIAIDAFLTECSTEFAANEQDIESLQSAQTAATERLDVIEADITANGERMDEFGTTAETMQSSITTNSERLDEFSRTTETMQANITANDERMDEFATTAEVMQASITTNNERLDGVDETIEAVQSGCDALEDRLEEIEAWRDTLMTFSARGGEEKEMSAVTYGAMASPENKDTIIVVLVVANVLLIIGCFVAACTACFGGKRGMGYAKVNPPEF